MRLDHRNLFFPANGLPANMSGRLLAAVLLGFLFVISAPPFVDRACPAKAAKMKGVYHRVKRGETLSRLSRAYKIPVKAIAGANGIKQTARLEFDSVLFIPGAKRVIEDTSPEAAPGKDKAAAKKTVKKEKQAAGKKPGKEDRPERGGREDRKEVGTEDDGPQKKGKTGPRLTADRKRVDKTTAGKTGEDGGAGTEDDPGERRPAATAGRAKREGDGQKKDRPQGFSRQKADDGKDAPPAAPGGRVFIWPVRGKVVSKFGLQPDGMLHNGIKIASRQDRPVVAAARGTVIYSAQLKDYGETIILKHDGSYATVYTSLGERMVKLGDRVRQGMKIGLPGKGAGKNEGTMTFEIRYRNKAVNPLRYLKQG